MPDTNDAIAALQASEARFRSVVEGSLQGIIIQQDGIIVYANSAMARLFGFNDASELIGLDPFATLIAEDDLRMFEERTAAAYAGAGLRPLPGWRGRHRGGRTIWISSSAHRSEWNGRPAVTSFYFDVTERVEAERALKESEARYRAALTAGRMGSWETDFVTGTRKWTEEGMALFGLTLENGVGRVGGDNDEFVRALHPDDRRLVPQFHELARTTDNFEAEYRVVGADGTIRWLSGRGQVVDRLADGRPHRLVSIMADITERKQAELHIRFLVREISHRSKNLLSVIQAIARQTAKGAGSLDGFVERFGSRLRGIAASHDLLVRGNWRGAPLAELVREQLAPFVDVGSGRIALSGPPLTLGAHAAQAIGLVLHELATNATKHGALSVPAGRLELSWRLEGGGEAETLRLEWREINGPPVTPPTQTGFGHVVLDQMITASLGGTVEIGYRPAGLQIMLSIPRSQLQDDAPTQFPG